MKEDTRHRRRREKARLRRELEARLSRLSRQRAREAGERLAEKVLALPEVAGARRVFTCLSFGVEIDTWRIVESLLLAGKEIYVPRVERGDPRLHVHRYPCPLRTLSFGLRQPERDAPEVSPAEIDGLLDVALVLGLAFDRRGYRLGYGGGYFDRFLPGRPFPAIGLAYGLQLLPELPTEAHDVAMSLVVTETG